MARRKASGGGEAQGVVGSARTELVIGIKPELVSDQALPLAFEGNASGGGVGAASGEGSARIDVEGVRGSIEEALAKAFVIKINTAAIRESVQAALLETAFTIKVNVEGIATTAAGTVAPAAAAAAAAPTQATSTPQINSAFATALKTANKDLLGRLTDIHGVLVDEGKLVGKETGNQGQDALARVVDLFGLLGEDFNQWGDKLSKLIDPDTFKGVVEPMLTNLRKGFAIQTVKTGPGAEDSGPFLTMLRQELHRVGFFGGQAQAEPAASTAPITQAAKKEPAAVAAITSEAAAKSSNTVTDALSQAYKAIKEAFSEPQAERPPEGERRGTRGAGAPETLALLSARAAELYPEPTSEARRSTSSRGRVRTGPKGGPLLPTPGRFDQPISEDLASFLSQIGVDSAQRGQGAGKGFRAGVGSLPFANQDFASSLTRLLQLAGTGVFSNVGVKVNTRRGAPPEYVFPETTEEVQQLGRTPVGRRTFIGDTEVRRAPGGRVLGELVRQMAREKAPELLERRGNQPSLIDQLISSGIPRFYTAAGSNPRLGAAGTVDRGEATAKPAAGGYFTGLGSRSLESVYRGMLTQRSKLEDNINRLYERIATRESQGKPTDKLLDILDRRLIQFNEINTAITKGPSPAERRRMSEADKSFAAENRERIASGFGLGNEYEDRARRAREASAGIRFARGYMAAAPFLERIQHGRAPQEGEQVRTVNGREYAAGTDLISMFQQQAKSGEGLTVRDFMRGIREVMFGTGAEGRKGTGGTVAAAIGEERAAIAHPLINAALGEVARELTGIINPSSKGPAMRESAPDYVKEQSRRGGETFTEQDIRRSERLGTGRVRGERFGSQHVSPGGESIDLIRRAERGTGAGSTALDLELQRLRASQSKPQSIGVAEPRPPEGRGVNLARPEAQPIPTEVARRGRRRGGRGTWADEGSLAITTPSFAERHTGISVDEYREREATRAVASRARIIERETATSRSLAAQFLARRRAELRNPETAKNWQGTDERGRPDQSPLSRPELMSKLALFAREQGLPISSPEYVDLQERVGQLLQRHERPQRVSPTGDETLTRAALDLPGAEANRPRTTREQVADAIMAEGGRSGGGTAGGGGGRRGTATGGGAPVGPGGLEPTADVINVFVKGGHLDSIGEAAAAGLGPGATREEQRTAARRGAALSSDIGVAQVNRFTGRRARDFTQRQMDRLVAEGMSPKKAAELIAGINAQYGAIAKSLVPEESAAGRGAGGTTGAAVGSLLGIRRRAGLEPLPRRTAAIDQSIDAQVSELAAESRKAERVIFKRGFTASVTDLFQNLTGALDKQVAAVNVFNREASQYQSILKEEAAQQFVAAGAKKTVNELDAKAVDIEHRLATETGLTSSEKRKLQTELRGVREQSRGASRVLSETEANLKAIGEARGAQEGILSGARANLPGVAQAVPNLLIGGLAASGAVAVGMITAQLAQQVMGGIAEAVGPLIERLTGFAGTVGRVQESLASETKARYDNIDSVLASTAAQTRMSEAALDLIKEDLSQRAQVVAGTQQLQARADIARTSLAAGGQKIEGYDRGLVRPTGGIFDIRLPNIPGLGTKDISLGGQASTAEVLASRLLDIKPISAPVERSQQIAQYQSDIINERNHFVPEGQKQELPGTDIGAYSKAIVDADKESQKSLDELNAELKSTGYVISRAVTDGDKAQLDVQYKIADSVQATSLGQVLKDSELVVTGPDGQPLAKSTDLLRFLEATTKIPVEPKQLLDENKVQFQNMRDLQMAQLRLSLGPGLTGQVGISRTLAPIQGATPITAPLEAAGANIPADLQQQANELQAGAFQDLLDTSKFISDTFNDPSLGRDFMKNMGEAAGYANAIADIKIGIETKQAAYQAEQYAYQIYQVKRSLADAKALTGEISASNKGSLGAIERQTYELQRQAQLLGFELTQRQINFKKAVAGFVVPGLTPDEQAARVEQAKIEADYAQKQLDIQKKLFGLAGKGFTIQASRQVQDLTKQLGLLEKGRALTLETATAEKQIQVLTALMEKPTARAQQVFAAAMQRSNDVLGVIAQMANAAQTSMAKVSSIVLQDFWDTYSNMVKIISGTNLGRPLTIGEQELRLGEDLNNNGHIGWASGFLGNVSSPTDVTVGEAGNETVAVIRNPRSMVPSQMSSGSGTVINISIVNNGGDIDDAALAKWKRQILVEIERRMGSRAVMLGVSGR